MTTPATPANAGHDRQAKHGLKIYTDAHTTIPFFDAEHTPTTIHHPEHATVGLAELRGRLEASLGDCNYHHGPATVFARLLTIQNGKQI
ncbi:hypothetical protein CYLTODRAFT_425255 [Cylindrobasidium torrendii FP15055 ss-10]|uniref:Uncharacterized protein n=1 Tax=Cylindrobasidium torrendii FP15055 ss-10 TaxID=1314674 RepID=A0A0D7B2F1_9AGAR|nr:hypothetical protein CYLTODRAFT_425255 [Cylindrobasidium torrendii FP15055 ss-10]